MNSTAARLRWLFAAQMGLSLAQLVAAVLPPFRSDYGPLTWALFGISAEPPMFVVFWCVFGWGLQRLRLLVLCLAAVYFAGMNVGYYAVIELIDQTPLQPVREDVYLRQLLEGFSRSTFFLGGLYGCLMAARLCQQNPRLAIPSCETADPKPTQFLLQHLFVITLLAAVYLGLARAYRYPWSEGLYDGRDWIGSVLLVLTWSINILLVSWAALGSGYVRQKACIALILALMTGLAYTASSVLEPVTIKSWLMYTLLMVELPTAILVGSLVILRLFGYRLVSQAV